MFDSGTIYFQLLSVVTTKKSDRWQLQSWGCEISNGTPYANTGCCLYLLTDNYTNDYQFGNRIYNSVYTKKENNTFFWYSLENTALQYNELSYVYYYLAF